MKTVVLGGSGFLGSHVADLLAQQGHEVILYDLRVSPYATPGQAMVVGDIRDAATLRAALKDAQTVYHFAGVTDLDDATTKPLDTVEQNVMGTAIALEAARQAGVKRFIYGSTIYVYSHLGGFYRCSKQAAELYIEEYQRRYGLDYTILRYGTLYGPRADARNSVYRYLRDGLFTKRIVFPGSGEEIREYVHVRDAARLSIEILADAHRNQHLIITGHHPMKTRDMLNIIREILRHDVTVEFSEGAQQTHYTNTPYSFIPKIGSKLVSTSYIDMGQGLLECLHEMSGVASGAASVS